MSLAGMGLRARKLRATGQRRLRQRREVEKMRSRNKVGLIVFSLAIISVASAAIHFYLSHHDSKTISMEAAEPVRLDLHKRFAGGTAPPQPV